MRLKLLLLNPMTQWMWWALTALRLQRSHAGQDLVIEYMASATGCRFGRFNRLCAHALLNKVSLGDMSYVGERSRLSNTSVGKFTCIGPDVLAGLGKHPTEGFASVHPAFYSPHLRTGATFATSSHFEEFADISIGNDVWIGARSIILDGSIIGDGAIVAAGAVVSGRIPAYAIVGGIPARVIRHRYSEEQIARLLELKWWNHDLEWLQRNHRLFHRVDDLLMAEG